MHFLNALFGKKRSHISLLINIGSASVTGAYVCFSEKESSTVWYSKSIAITFRHDESPQDAMFRALKELLEFLIREGSPIVIRAVGTSKVDSFFMSLDAPWQETAMRIERIEPGNPFLFTKNSVASVLNTKSNGADKVIAHESVVGTVLNGYEVRDPYDTKVHRAEIIILTSLIDPYVIGGIRALFKELYHTKHIRYVAGTALSYEIMRTAFPHNHNALILEANGNGTTITLLRKGMLVAVSEVPHASDQGSWVEEVKLGLTSIAKQYVLPRTIFLLAPASNIASLQEKLTQPDFKSFWFSDNPPTILAILPTHVIGSIQWLASNPPDVSLILMIRYWQHSLAK
jgi:hypothetical protein